MSDLERLRRLESLGQHGVASRKELHAVIDSLLDGGEKEVPMADPDLSRRFDLLMQRLDQFINHTTKQEQETQASRQDHSNGDLGQKLAVLFAHDAVEKVAPLPQARKSVRDLLAKLRASGADPTVLDELAHTIRFLERTTADVAALVAATTMERVDAQHVLGDVIAHSRALEFGAERQRALRSREEPHQA